MLPLQEPNKGERISTLRSKQETHQVLVETLGFELS